jgi:hypothetical protein
MKTESFFMIGTPATIFAIKASEEDQRDRSRVQP